MITVRAEPVFKNLERLLGEASSILRPQTLIGRITCFGGMLPLWLPLGGFRGRGIWETGAKVTLVSCDISVVANGIPWQVKGQ
jgi:hypothetical protein